MIFWSLLSAPGNEHTEWPARAHPAPTLFLSPGNSQSFLSDTGWSLGALHVDSISFCLVPLGLIHTLSFLFPFFGGGGKVERSFALTQPV